MTEPTNESTRPSIFDIAKELTESTREKEYGPARVVYTHAGQYIGKYLGIPPLAADQVMMILILVKIARESMNHKRDNLIDIAGYAKLIDDYFHRL